MLLKFVPTLIAALLLAGPVQAANIEEIVGEWRTVRHGADIEIRDCGDGTPCGYLISVGQTITGRDRSDIRNPDKSLRNRPLSGLQLLSNYTRKKDHWESGKLYNPETGQTFGSSIRLISPNALKVQGCIGPFCRAQVWTRITEETLLSESQTHD